MNNDLGGQGIVLSSLTAIAVLVAPSAVADENTAVVSSIGENELSNGEMLRADTVYVTATRGQATTIQDIGSSVSVLRGDELERSGADGFTEFLLKTPGVALLDQGSGQTKIVMRGVSSDDRAESSATVGVYLDEVPITSAGAPVNGVQSYALDVRPFDLARVEVLRGPQGTLFGAGSMGGTVRLITNPPDATSFGFKANANASKTRGGDSNTEIDAALNVPLITDKLALRLVGYDVETSGFIDNVAANFEKDDINHVNTSGGRAMLRWTANEDLTLSARYMRQERTTGGSPFDNTRRGFPVFVQDKAADERSTDEYDQLNFVGEYDLGWGQLTASATWDQRNSVLDYDFTFPVGILFGLPSALPGSVGRDFNDVTRNIQEARVSSSYDGPIQFVAGIYKYDQKQTLGQRFFAPGFTELIGIPTGPPLGNVEDVIFESNINRRLDEVAVFGEATFHLNDKIDVVAGLRWFDVSIDFASASTGFANGGPNGSQQDMNEDGLNPKLALSWKPDLNTHLYASATRGYRVGGIVEQVPSAVCGADLAARGLTAEQAARFDSDSLWSYELGAKKQLFENKFSASVSAYHIEWSDIQTTEILPCFFAVVDNVGSATSTGVEWDFHVMPSKSWQIGFSGSYNDASFDAAPSIGISDGDELPGVPQLTLSTSAQYDFSIYDRDAYVRFDHTYTGERKTGFGGVFTPSGRSELESYHLIDARFGLRFENAELALFADNVFDERAETFISDLFGVARHQPRTIGVSLRWAS